MAKLDDLVSQLKAAIARYLQDYVVSPATGLVNTDFTSQDDIANLLVLHRLLRDAAQADAGMAVDRYLRNVVDEHASDNDLELPQLLSQLAQQGEHMVELRTVFCSYIFSLANAICIAILSASYLSALIVTRSLLELLVGLGSGRTGSMADKIEALAMLAPDEKKVISDSWRELCGWSHPHGRWLKRLCPVLVAKGPLHHPMFTRECLAYLGICTDLAFAVGFDKFNMDADSVRSQCTDQHVDYRRFMFIRRRVEVGKTVSE